MNTEKCPADFGFPDLSIPVAIRAVSVISGKVLVFQMARGPLDKSEVPVKDKLSLSMPGHRCCCQREVKTKNSGKHLRLNHPWMEGL